ncbi:Uncharacterized protein Fot_49561 [Forsythia ovata]|uniref:Uncharacterized protein n=1 Tax=Forsythia ovata TaxID=205694 RepID=A0ABD1QC90_9LAMI
MASPEDEKILGTRNTCEKEGGECSKFGQEQMSSQAMIGAVTGETLHVFYKEINEGREDELLELQREVPTLLFPFVVFLLDLQKPYDKKTPVAVEVAEDGQSERKLKIYAITSFRQHFFAPFPDRGELRNQSWK